MGLYAGKDLKLTLGGDLEISSNGDLKLGTEAESLAAHVCFRVRTDRGEYRPDTRIGANLGTLIGSIGKFEDLKALTKTYLRTDLDDDVLYPQDYQIELVEVDPHMVLLLMKIDGTFLSPPNELDDHEILLTFEFPYLDRAPETVGVKW